MNDLDIKLQKDNKFNTKGKLWQKIKTYAIVAIIIFLMIKSDLYTIISTNMDNLNVIEICFAESDDICTKSVIFKY